MAPLNVVCQSVPVQSPLTVGISVWAAEGGVISQRRPKTTLSESFHCSVSWTNAETVVTLPA